MSESGSSTNREKPDAGSIEQLSKASQDQQVEISKLKKQIMIIKKEHEMEMISLKQAHKDELKRMQQLVDYDVDKRQYFDLERDFKLVEDQNRVLTTEIRQLRKVVDQKDQTVERTEKRLAESQKQFTLAKMEI